MLSTTLQDGLSEYGIGEKIRTLRLKKKMGLVELGTHTGLSPALLSKIERGLHVPDAADAAARRARVQRRPGFLLRRQPGQAARRRRPQEGSGGAAGAARERATSPTGSSRSTSPRPSGASTPTSRSSSRSPTMRCARTIIRASSSSTRCTARSACTSNGDVHRAGGGRLDLLRRQRAARLSARERPDVHGPGGDGGVKRPRVRARPPPATRRATCGA